LNRKYENDLSTTCPEKTREVHNDLLKWQESINAPVPTELNPEYNSHRMLNDSIEVK